MTKTKETKDPFVRLFSALSHRAPTARGWGVVLMLLSVLTLGCLTPRRLEPVAGGALAEASGGGLSLTANGDAWTGAGLTASRSVPVWVEVVNRSNAPVRVADTDWVMVSEEGEVVGAIAPHPDFVLPAPTPSSADSTLQGNSLASREWIAPIAYRQTPSGRMQRATYPAASNFQWSAGRWGVMSRRGRNAVMTGQPVRTWDMIRLALGETMLQPGEKMGGFVYFPRAMLRAQRLALTWLVHDPKGEPLGMLNAQFRVRSEGSDPEVSNTQPQDSGSGTPPFGAGQGAEFPPISP